MKSPPVGLHRLEDLVSYCLDLAKQMLEKHGAFFPFGAVIDSSGKRIPVTGNTGNDQQKTPEVYRLIQRSMNAQYRRGEIVAGAIVAEVTIPAELKPSHPKGLRMAVESASVARIVFLPYVKSGGSGSGPEANNHFEFGELLGLDVRPSIFVGE
jgi:hypothetical protein